MGLLWEEEDLKNVTEQNEGATARKLMQCKYATDMVTFILCFYYQPCMTRGIGHTSTW
jgi:hypothetical protein